MRPTKAQFNDIKRRFPNAVRTDCTIVCEGGSDSLDGTHFLGDFVVMMKGGLFRFNENGDVRKIRC